MTMYDPQLVDTETRDTLLQILAPYQAFQVLFDILDSVALRLVKTTFPLEETYPWLTGMPAPVDVYEHRNDHIPGRSFQLWFWRRLYTEVEYDPPRQRWNDGNRSPDEQLIETILSRLKVFPFEVAINTWLAVCVEWLQWCNVEEFLVEAKKRGISIAEARDIPKHMAGMVELVYI
jgi:hypothetical protein